MMMKMVMITCIRNVLHMCDGDYHNDDDDDDDSLWQTLFSYCWQCNVRAWGM